MPRKTRKQLTADPIIADPLDPKAATPEGPTRPAPRPRARRKVPTTSSPTVAEPLGEDGVLDSLRPQVDADSAVSPQADEAEPSAAAVPVVAKPPFTPADGELKAPKPGTKQALVVDLLSRDEGATVTELQAATGWLPHTTRAALTGLRQRGHVLAASKVDGVRRYRILTPCLPADQDGVSFSLDATAGTEAGQ